MTRQLILGYSRGFYNKSGDTIADLKIILEDNYFTNKSSNWDILNIVLSKFKDVIPTNRNNFWVALFNVGNISIEDIIESVLYFVCYECNDKIEIETKAKLIDKGGGYERI